MVLHFVNDLQKSLELIELKEHKEFIVHSLEEEKNYENADEIVEKHGEHKWNIIDVLNKEYELFLQQKFDLHNWLNDQEQDEVAYFLNEAGSNVLSYSQFKAPYRFLLWLGEKGFVIGVEQKGKGFDAQEINSKKLKENEGAAFDFYRGCKSKVFFDNASDARIVFMEYLFH